MRAVSVRRTLFALLAVLAWLVVPYAQTDPSAGTWELNVSKSKYDPGPAPKSNTVTIAVSGNVMKVTAKGVAADGSPTGTSYSSNLDGKDTPAQIVGAHDYDSVALKRVGANRVEGTRSLKGKVVQTYSREVSADGKTMTATIAGTNAAGQKINNVAVYDKK